MIEIHPNLYVGHRGDYECQAKGQDGWATMWYYRNERSQPPLRSDQLT